MGKRTAGLALKTIFVILGATFVLYMLLHATSRRWYKEWWEEWDTRYDVKNGLREEMFIG